MGTVFLLLLGALLVHGVRLSQEEEHHLEPVSFVQDTPADSGARTICTQDCYPNQDCVYSAWGAWGPCWGISACGGPYFVNRTRSVLINSLGNGTSCKSESLFDSRACNDTELSQLVNSPTYTSSCAVPCVQGPWYVKVPCNVGAASCPPRPQAPPNGIMNGQIIMGRDTTQQPKYGGAACGKNEDVQQCSYNCVYDCQWSDWMPNGCELPCIPPANGSVTNGQKWFRTIQYFPVNGGATCVGDTTKTDGPCENTANFPICCPGCTEGPWGDWTGCTLTCGSGGNQQRTRTVTPPQEFYSNPAVCAGAMPVCGATVQTQECCKSPCQVDCQCGEWSGWSDCFSDESMFLQCGAGTKTRTRACTQPQWGGQACPETTQTVDCFLPGCPTPCEVSTWSDFSPCPASCGVRVMHTRTREVLVQPENGGAPCPPLDDTRACPCIDCPTDCQLSDWGEWQACSTPCGPGTQIRTRDVLVAPRNGGVGCLPDDTIQTKDCVVNDLGWYQSGPTQLPANKPCDVNCQVGPWSDWGGCSQTCTSDVDSTFPGIQSRTRTITVPPQYEGASCPNTIEQQWCATQCCPVDMQLSDWTDWTDCSVSCGGGHQYRRRVVDVYPRCGGNVIDEPLEDSRTCNPQCCQQDCVYYAYSTYSPCLNATSDQINAILNQAISDSAKLTLLANSFAPLTCPQTAGMHYRNRAVRIGNPCGSCTDTWDVKPCYENCPVECVMYGWSDWSPCQPACGYGSQRKTRSIKTPAANGGSPCPCTEEYRPCYNGACCTDCTLTPWNDWEPCSATCGGGDQYRRRFVNMSTTLCPEMECVKQGTLDHQSCNNFPCPKPCEMNDWGTWSTCSADCGPGYQYRTRTVKDFGAGGCPWDWEEQPCNNGECPIPCLYTEWTDWTPCGATCVPASSPASIQYKQYRAKYRISGPADDSCPPTVPDDMPCSPYPPPCDVLCQVSEWGNWSDCSSPWGWGQQKRERTVTTNPTGDNLCPQLYQIQRCYHQPPANNCTFSDWSDWSDCSATCRQPDAPTPIRERQRVLITSPSTTDHTDAQGNIQSSVTLDESACKDYGDLAEPQQCTWLPFCPVDCVMTRWSAWSKCMAPGMRYRTRRVYSPPAFGGAPCPICVKEDDHCTVQSNDGGLPVGECEVGPCLQEVEAELAAKQNGGTNGEAQVSFTT